MAEAEIAAGRSRPRFFASLVERRVSRKKAQNSQIFFSTFCDFCAFLWLILLFLLGRFERLAIERKDPYLKDGAAPQLKKFYYEIAQANHPGALDALLELIPLSNVLFGTDYPLRPASEAVEGLTKYSKFTDAQRRIINRENAERLIPRLKA